MLNVAKFNFMPDTASKLMVRPIAISRDVDNQNDAAITLENAAPIQFVEISKAATSHWDNAYEIINAESNYSFAEPEIDSSAMFYADEMLEDKGELPKDSYYQFLEDWTHPPLPGIWHLNMEFSQLRPARAAVKDSGKAKKIRIAHLDTGYHSAHISFPGKFIRKDLERNFVEGEEDRWPSAEDQLVDGLLKMPGHGTGTLSILAGAHVNIPELTFDDSIGLAHEIEIVPIRIAKSVVLFKTGAFVKAMGYILNELSQAESTQIHVITMSMGGLASGAWADVVNQAYEQGIFMVSAAGNNFKKLPTRTMVYPARFNRVVAACGVAYDRSPYAKPWGEGSRYIMEGNYGPQSLMGTAVAAFTPNVPWATYRFNDVIGIRGDGTSSATPQIAAAAALYYSLHHDKLLTLPEPWMRVEAIRNALFKSAEKIINHQNNRYEDDYTVYYGNGILQAMDMLKVPVSSPGQLTKQQIDTVRFPFFKLIFGLKTTEETLDPEEEMMETELMQLVLSDERLQVLLHNEEKRLDELSSAEKIKLADIILDTPRASTILKQQMRLFRNQQLENTL
ncbi:S8/S53 family peptidase [Chitinophaga sp.]|uniref:S8 family peptidase n=1 Tax=Chitinophaga sp. TaxID=1869181 RepID=UPI0031D90872